MLNVNKNKLLELSNFQVNISTEKAINNDTTKTL